MIEPRVHRHLSTQCCPILWLCLCSLPYLVSANTYYVTPSGNVSCPGGYPCLTLTDYANQPPNATVTNITMLFVEGEHSLSRNFSLSNVSHISLANPHGHSLKVTINCSYNGKFLFESADNVLISNISMIGCYGNNLKNIDLFVIENSFIQGLPTNYQGQEAIRIDGVKDFSAVNCKFELNEVKNSGFLACSVFSIWDSNIKLLFTEFVQNYAESFNASCTYYPLSSTLCVFGSNITIESSMFTNNSASTGGVLYAEASEITILQTNFSNNHASDVGGVVYISHCTGYRFSDSSASLSDLELDGSVDLNPSMYISQSSFSHNSARSGGGIYNNASGYSLYMDTSSVFENNSAIYGGAITVRNSSSIHINENLVSCNNDTMVKFINNSAHFGGALNIIENSVARVHCATFEHNSAGGSRDNLEYRGGAILARTNTKVNLTNTNFVGNNASGKGGMLFAQFAEINTFGYLNIQYNSGQFGAFYLTSCTAKFSGHLLFANNEQSFFIHYSDITFMAESTFADQNVHPNYSKDSELQGGAITALRSTILVLDVVFTVQNNQGDNGGGILLTESTLDIKLNGQCIFLNNSASKDGGAIDAYQSELKFRGNVIFQGNVANRNGGAIFLRTSSIEYSSQFLDFSANTAMFGGAIYFDRASTLYITKEIVECERHLWYCTNNQSEWLLIRFSDNSADERGGAMYVNDVSATSCSSDSELNNKADDECFIQSLAVYESAYDWNVREIDANLHNINFTNNTAGATGSVLYGGLLDRCRVDDYAELRQIWDTTDALEYFKVLSGNDFLATDIASDPVRICACNDNFEVNCSMTFRDKLIERGKTFGVRVAIVDQIGTPFMNGTVKASLSSEGSRLKDSQQSEQLINGQCTELNFTVFTNESVTLTLFPEGPCDQYGLSRVKITLHIKSDCPLGFSLSESSLECVCDPQLQVKGFIDNCSIETSTVKRRGNVWISNSENNITQSGIIAHRYCPYDYCLPPNEEVFVNLSDKHGSDAQCAFNRIGRLCGCCDVEANFSLTLGSSECQKCTNYSLFLIIPFGLAGIALVILMMVCNLTLASGTINGLLFYANILISNRFVFFPPQGQTFLTVFVSWLGVNLGIATCFYRGLDGFGKIWLQIAFEAYLIFLMFVVILLGKSVKVSTFFHKYNLYPVHTLATLIMLSYEKLSRKVFSLVAFTELLYSDDTTAEPRVWIFDPCLDDKVKHVTLYVVASFIIITGIIFNFILLFNKFLISKCKSIYFITFMEAFHAPFKPKHRYWVGLLLLVRNISYFISDYFNAGENPSWSLHFIFTLIIGILLIKFFYVGMPNFFLSKLKRYVLCRQNTQETQHTETVQESGIVYKNPFVDFLETSLLVNLLVLTYFTLYLRNELEKSTMGQTILFDISSSIVFITFVGILIYHTCVYTCFARLFRHDHDEERAAVDAADDVDNERMQLSYIDIRDSSFGLM